MEKSYILIIIVLALLHYIYTTATLRDITITVKSKYVLYNRLSRMMVSSTNGDVYEVGNNIWLWQFKAVELWDTLKEGKTYTLQVYGNRYPIIDVFPVIVNL